MKIIKIRGQGLTELALAFPLFLIIVFFIFDAGRTIYYLSAIHNAAREGARYGAVHPCDTPGIITRAQNFSFGLGNAVTVNPSIQYTPSPSLMDRMIVGVTYNFTTITPLVGNFLGEDGSIILNSQSHQYIEVKTDCP